MLPLFSAKTTKGDQLSLQNRRLRKYQITFKALTSFGQIVGSVGFNCAISFPPLFERALALMRFLSFDITPALGLSCRLQSFDYVDKVISVTLFPLVLCGILGVAYMAVVA